MLGSKTMNVIKLTIKILRVCIICTLYMDFAIAAGISSGVYLSDSDTNVLHYSINAMKDGDFALIDANTIMELEAVIAKVQDGIMVFHKLEDIAVSEQDKKVINFIKNLNALEFMASFYNYNDKQELYKLIDRFIEFSNFVYMPLLNLYDAGINPFSFLLESNIKEVCIGASCGHINEVFIISNISKVAKRVVNEVDTQKLDLLLRDVQFSWESYLMSMIDTFIHKLRNDSFLNILNDDFDQVLFEKLENFRAFNALSLLYMSKDYIRIMLNDYLDDVARVSNIKDSKQLHMYYGGEISKYYTLCIYPKYLNRKSIDECVKFFESSTHLNMNDVAYDGILSVDSKPCIAYDGFAGKLIGFENKNVVCESLKKRFVEN